MDAFQIAIGKKVFSVRFNLKCKGSSSTCIDHRISLDYDSVKDAKEMKCYLADEEETPLE
jgi:hypothetical protein